MLRFLEERRRPKARSIWLTAYVCIAVGGVNYYIKFTSFHRERVSLLSSVEVSAWLSLQ